MKFLVCERQSGEGCDYMIGCGMDFYFKEACSEEALIEYLIYPDGEEECCSLEGERARSDILILPAEHVTELDVADIFCQVEEKRLMAKQEELMRTEEAKEAVERKEYARLKKKFEKAS